ncbi:hypothetical protein MAR_000221 [Mya arenaria]|uniref:Uncharacterized protein n=1 Tax=Mya arenaria TaxID=6604 RepID=A0ABY7FCI1_MYAAR|nr:uncharacterized protein LOC128208990 [Mya arenaria]XP_052768734.1 uncharacterized protein LOC128208990 [Mya arenaria]WAR18383.1 hypothetical protein MAR_000221 [Mya arenaria]
MADTIKVTPGGTDEAHPEVFDSRAMPPQPTEKKPGQLSEEMIKKFFDDGFVIVEDFFDKKDMDACREAVNELVEQLAQKLYKAGKIKDLYKDLGFFERLIKIEADFPGANIILHKYGKLPAAFKALWTNERLLDVVEQLIGPNIAGHPVWNLRTKTPQNEATTVPWHQDVGYLDNNSYTVLQPTAWIPLLDANEFNGCMELMNKGHRSGKVGTHQCCHGGTWYVMLEEQEMKDKLAIDVEKDRVLCRVPYGGMLLLNNMIPHRSLPNVSSQIRWSLDLRWQDPALPNGFYNMKECVLMRTADNPDLQVDWDKFEGIDRHPLQKEAVADMNDVIPKAESEDFDTTIQGPWMKKWDIVHVNQHVSKLDQNQDYATWHGHKA